MGVMTYIPRKLEQSIRQFLDAPEIIAVLGARQCGKTTMIEHLISKLPRAVSLSFEDQKTLALFEQAPDDFISAYVKGNQYLFIDEFQYARHGGKILKYIYDKEKIKIIISGSSALEITIRAVKYLVGRIVVFELFPFDFEEWLMAKDQPMLKVLERYKKQEKINKSTPSIALPVHEKLIGLHEEYMRFGGYPRVVIEENLERKEQLLQNIYNTYFLREVRDVLGLIDDYKLQMLLKALSLQVGNLIEYEELGRLSGFSFPTLKKILNFLEKTYVCRFIRPFYKNKRTEIVKNPKVYFFDTGLRNATIGDFRKSENRPDAGAMLENGLVMEMMKKGYDIHFWRDKKQHELDFIINRGNQDIIALESKSYLKSGSIPSVSRFESTYPDIPIHFSYAHIDPQLKGKIKNAFPAYML
ncbi:MAG: ATP-binding protein [Candidatus Gracilibacteria bacterium]